MATVMFISAIVIVLAVVAILVVRRADSLPGRFEPPDYWPYCLDDFGPLTHGPDGQLQCETCATSYRVTMLDQVDPDDWAELAQDRLFCRQCAELEPACPASIPTRTGRSRARRTARRRPHPLRRCPLGAGSTPT